MFYFILAQITKNFYPNSVTDDFDDNSAEKIRIQNLKISVEFGKKCS